MSTSRSPKNDDIIKIAGSLDAVIFSQGIAARLVRDALPQLNIAQDVIARYNIAESAVSLVSQQAVLAKGFETQWLASITPQLNRSALMVSDSIDSVLKNAGFIQPLQPAWMKSVSDSIGFLQSENFRAFAGIGDAVLKQWSDTFSKLDFAAIERRLLLPYNWPEDFEEYLPAIQEILNNEGLPLAWVPRRELLLHLLKAKSAEKRLNLLRKHRDEVLEGCAEVVYGLDDEFLAGQTPLARDVIAACKDGHWTAGAVLAVTITHGIVERLNWATNPTSVKARYRFSMEVKLNRMIEGVTQASLVSFYEEWHPKSPKPEPRFLTRHMVSHNVTESHLNEHNCLVAVMLMASVMETVSQLELGPRELAA